MSRASILKNEAARDSLSSQLENPEISCMSSHHAGHRVPLGHFSAVSTTERGYRRPRSLVRARTQKLPSWPPPMGAQHARLYKWKRGCEVCVDFGRDFPPEAN